MGNIRSLVNSSEHLETNVETCNLKGIVAHLRIVSMELGKLEQKREDKNFTMNESKQLHEYEEKLANSINKIKTNCICSKK